MRPGPLGAVVPGGHSNRLGGAVPSRPDGPGPGSSTGRTARRPDPAGAKYLGAGRGASSFGVFSVRRPDARTGRRPAAGCFRPARCTSGRGGRGDPVRRSATLSWLGKVVDVMAGTGAGPARATDSFRVSPCCLRRHKVARGGGHGDGYLDGPMSSGGCRATSSVTWSAREQSDPVLRDQLDEHSPEGVAVLGCEREVGEGLGWGGLVPASCRGRRPPLRP